MSECFFGTLGVCSEDFPDLCYSNVLGIENAPRFACREYTEENHVLVYVNRGIFICKQKSFSRVLREGEYILLDKRIVHTYCFDPAIPSEIHWMHINGSLANLLIKQISDCMPLPFVGQNPWILSLLKRCILSHREHSATPFSHSSEIMNILHVILEDAFCQKKEKRCSKEELDFKDRVETVICSTDLREITLDYFCNQLNLSKYYFSHRFKCYYGISPIKYLNQHKLARARQLLRSSDMKIALVAQKCGFSSSSRFSTVFRKEFGLSPESYRNERNMNRKDGDHEYSNERR